MRNCLLRSSYHGCQRGRGEGACLPLRRGRPRVVRDFEPWIVGRQTRVP